MGLGLPDLVVPLAVTVLPSDAPAPDTAPDQHGSQDDQVKGNGRPQLIGRAVDPAGYPAATEPGNDQESQRREGGRTAGVVLPVLNLAVTNVMLGRAVLSRPSRLTAAPEQGCYGAVRRVVQPG